MRQSARDLRHYVDRIRKLCNRASYCSIYLIFLMEYRVNMHTTFFLVINNMLALMSSLQVVPCYSLVLLQH